MVRRCRKETNAAYTPEEVEQMASDLEDGGRTLNLPFCFTPGAAALKKSLTLRAYRARDDDDDGGGGGGGGEGGGGHGPGHRTTSSRRGSSAKNGGGGGAGCILPAKRSSIEETLGQTCTNAKQAQDYDTQQRI